MNADLHPCFVGTTVYILHTVISLALPVPGLPTGQARGEDPPLLPEGGQPQHPPPADQAGHS